MTRDYLESMAWGKIAEMRELIGAEVIGVVLLVGSLFGIVVGSEVGAARTLFAGPTPSRQS